MNLTLPYSGPKLQALQVEGLNNNDSDLIGLYDALQQISLGAINHIVQVNDCETSGDWTESNNGTFDYAVGNTGKRVGTNALKLTATGSTDNSQYVETLFIDESTKPGNAPSAQDGLDWSDTRYLGFWYHAEDSAEYGTDGEMKVALLYMDDTISSKVDLTGAITTVHAWFEVDMIAEGWVRKRVKGLRFYSNNTNTGEVLNIDDISRYELSNGIGPIYGSAFPIKSGTTLTNGRIAAWSIDGLVEEGAAAIETLGQCVFLNKGATGIGVAKRNVFGIIPGLYIQMVKANAQTQPGEGLIRGTNTSWIGVSTGVDEFAAYKGLEAAGAAGDVIFAVQGLSGSFTA